MTKITMVGTGYVGLVSGALFADRGNKVICVDNNPGIIETLKQGKLPLFEPGLEEIVKRNVQRENLTFTQDLKKSVKESDVIFLAVGTPSTDNGSFNLRFVREATKDVAKALKDARGFKTIVCKSTVPQRTNESLSDIISKELNNNSQVEWAYVSNPETLSEGTAVRDFSRPDRVILGTDSPEAMQIMKDLYHPFVRREGDFEEVSPASAEMIKLGSNMALALRVAMVNELARIADVTPGADMEEVRKGIGSDKRIGYTFLFPGPGYGGSCFPKDIQGLVNQAKKDGYDPLLLSKVHESNETHKEYMGERIMKILKETRNPSIAVWGLTFKPHTDDMRDSASVPIITRFISERARVSVYDPQDEKARLIFKEQVHFCDDPYEAAKDADALVLLTEWPQFDSPDYDKLKSLMKGRTLFDLRNRWIPRVANKEGFDYFGVGREFPLE